METENSNCCDQPLIENTDLCSQCKEHTGQEDNATFEKMSEQVIKYLPEGTSVSKSSTYNNYTTANMAVV